MNVEYVTKPLGRHTHYFSPAHADVMCVECQCPTDWCTLGEDRWALVDWSWRVVQAAGRWSDRLATSSAEYVGLAYWIGRTRDALEAIDNYDGPSDGPSLSILFDRLLCSASECAFRLVHA
jgi:hypothetical protein